MAQTLPEGTDHIVPATANNSGTGSTAAASAGTGGTIADTASAALSDTADTVSDAADKTRAQTGDLRDKAAAKVDEVKAQAVDKARDYAQQGKEKASGALDQVARLIGDNATQIDDALGAQYGDYARRAQGLVSDAATTLRDKDVEELLEDVRSLVRRSPAIAVGAAAALGFLVARVVKSGSESLESAAHRLDPSAPSGPAA